MLRGEILRWRFVEDPFGLRVPFSKREIWIHSVDLPIHQGVGVYAIRELILDLFKQPAFLGVHVCPKLLAFPPFRIEVC